ncbi:regulator of sigma E protease [Amphibacillus marinus]|uniref:Zinc metalloprotease n=1 Tax=Amphibacillus marinus TaxID=872970 RepID=A0A1H8HP05_9BACI|nr:RIP metalloprotease RseP [Amphibacillus marinus]SEN57418.1 regulator of sigma E protease [Amphibacillus marinus]
MNTIVAFILMFGLLVFVHEFGHFIVAKKTGMLVREFAIGFGPKIFSIKRAETLYTIRILPMGGYVRVAGEDPEIVELKPGQHIGLKYNKQGQVNKIIVNNKDKHPTAEVIEVEQADLTHQLQIKGMLIGEEEVKVYQIAVDADYVMNESETRIAPFDRQFAAKTKLQRSAQLFAGPLMNFILTALLFFALAAFSGIPVEDARLGEIAPNSPAEQAGLQPGDQITQIDQVEINSWLDFQRYVSERPNQELTINYLRDGEADKLTIVPTSEQLDDSEVGRIGVRQYMERSVTRAIPYSLTQTYEWSKLILVNLGMLVTGQFSVDMLSGPVGIYDFTDQVVQTGFWNFVQWTAALSVNLGIINLLPLPALDGGRLLFVGIEAIRGKPISPEKEGLVHFVGFALLMLLMVIVTWNDIQRLFL